MKQLHAWVTSLIVLVGAACQGEAERTLDVAPVVSEDAGTPHSAAAKDQPPSCAAQHRRMRPVGLNGTSSTVVLGQVGRDTVAVVADRDERALIVVDLSPLKERHRVPLPGRPEQVLMLDDGRLVTSLSDRHAVVVHELGADGLQERCSRVTPREPAGMAAEGDKLVVASRWDAKLTPFVGAELKPEPAIDLPRDPYGVALTPGGDTALVTHVVGGRVSRVALPSRTVAAVDATRTDVKTGGVSMKEAFPMFMPQQVNAPRKGQRRMRKRSFPRGVSIEAKRTATQAYAIAAVDENKWVVPASLADPTPAPRGGTGYGGSSMVSGLKPHLGVNLELNAAGDIDVPRGNRLTHHACLLPRDVAFDVTSHSIWVACHGSSTVLAFERSVDDDLEAKALRELPRVALKVAAGPTGLAVDPAGRRLVVWSQFAGTIAVHPLPDRVTGLRAKEQDMEAIDERLSLSRAHPLAPQVALGRRLFHLAGASRRIAFDGRACASCHPGGRDDGITWTTEDGPRNTPILAGRLGDDTKPYGWNGRNEALDGHLQRTLQRLRGTGLKRAERDAIFAYIRQMELPAASEKNERIERGAELFASADVGCADCHDAREATTDGRTHDLGMLAKNDRIRDFDTPSLRFVARSAPYFHDGRYPTLQALLSDPESNMGHAADLSTEDRAALEDYLRTL